MSIRRTDRIIGIRPRNDSIRPWGEYPVTIGVDFEARAGWPVHDAAGGTAASLIVVEQQHAQCAALELLPGIGQPVVVGVGFRADQPLAPIALASIDDTVAARRALDPRVLAYHRHPRILMAVTPARLANPSQLAGLVVVLPPVDTPIAIAVGLQAHRPPVAHVGARVDNPVPIGVVVQPHEPPRVRRIHAERLWPPVARERHDEGQENQIGQIGWSRRGMYSFAP